MTQEFKMPPEFEKVIKGLECCRINELRRINCADCPYYTDDDKGQMWCSNDVHNDAIELLKIYNRIINKEPFQCKDCEYYGDKYQCPCYETRYPILNFSCADGKRRTN